MTREVPVTPVALRNWQYLASYRRQREEILALVDTVFSSGQLILGQYVRSFEEQFAAYCGASFGVGVNSGTDALFLGLKALGIGPGDEVVTVANTAVPTVAAIRAAGATPVFVDVEADTYLMDVSRVAEVLTERTRCLLPVHLCGHPVDLAPLLALARDRGIPILEDCAQATGAEYQGQRVGSLGTIGAFSFYPTKILGAFGDGGIAITSDAELAARLRRLRFYGMEQGYYAEEEGYNSRLDELQAALLQQRLPSLDNEVAKRRRLAALYRQGLSGVGDLHLPVTRPGCSHQYYLYTIRTRSRDRLRSWLAECGIEARINYPTPIHLMRGYDFLAYRVGSLPVTECLAGEILSLPIYPDLLPAEVERVVTAVCDFYRRGEG